MFPSEIYNEILSGWIFDFAVRSFYNMIVKASLLYFVLYKLTALVPSLLNGRTLSFIYGRITP
jgi:hypothetical protein